MKTKLLFLFAWLMLAITGCSADEPRTELPDTPSEEKPEEPVEPSGDKKVLVVYFSHTGNTRTIAGYIHDTVKSDLMEIKTNGRVLSEVVRVMEICEEANIIFATGHSSPEESIVLARKAREIGVKKCVVTHANSGIWEMTHDQIKRCIDLGAWVEYSYITNLWGPGTGLPDFERMSNREFADFARIAPERSIITTDLGQVGMPHPVDGMRCCILALLENGLSQQQVDFMVRTNPAQLVERSALR